jgi:flagellar biosynthesis/type III secretory pathway protein FliH
MSKPVFEISVNLPAKLVSIRQEESPAPATPQAEVDKLLLAEKLRQEKKEHEAIERVLENLLEAATSLRARQQEHLEEMQRLAIELAMAIASHLLHDRIEAGDYPVENLARKLAERLDTPQPVTVFLNPADLTLLQERLREGPLFPHGADVQLVADAGLARGNARAQAGDISVVADLDDQLADIARNLRETLPAAVQPAPELRAFEEKRQSA